MASQQKQEKIFIFNDRNLAKTTRNIFNFSWQNKVTTNPRPYLKVYMASQQKQEKYIFLTTETWQKNIYIFYFSWRNEGNNKPQTLLKVYMASQQKQEKKIIFNDRNLAKNKKNIFLFIFHGLFFNFSWEQGNNKPQTLHQGLYGVIEKKNEETKYLFLTNRNLASQKTRFIF